MASIVEQLQSDALKQSVSVSNLLRHVKLIAAKLKLGQVEDWVQKELDGYGNSEIPEYRLVRGAPRAHNPFHGWIPIVLDDPELMDALSTREIGQKISELEDLLTDTTQTTLQIPFPPHTVMQLNQNARVPLADMALHVSRAAVVGIVDSVRNRILDWAIELERSGIKGSEISFSADEQSIAKQPAVTMHIGNIHNFTGNLGVGNNSGDITLSKIDVDKVKFLVSQIKNHTDTLIGEGVDSDTLNDAINRVEKALSSKDNGLLKQGLNSIRAIVEQAAGGLTSTGVLTLLHRLLGTGAGA
jgi:hypothetical protein